MALLDCKRHGQDADNELIVVEGVSAADNVKRSRDADIQAVFALQGKPINAAKASQTRIEKHPELQGLIKAIGCGIGDDLNLQSLRYKRIVLLFDPDADGIHCGALVQIFLQTHMSKLIAQSKIVMVRAPLFEITIKDRVEPVMVYSQQHYDKISAYLRKNGEAYQTTRFKGVASLSVELVRSTCLNSKTRKAQVLTTQDALMAVRLFG